MNETATLEQAEQELLLTEERKIWKNNITDAIDLLDEQERLVMALHYHEELTLPEISQVLDIPISKVKIIRDKTLKVFLQCKLLNAEERYRD
jgi:RNA polymerase sigma factor (sigma-70 family)